MTSGGGGGGNKMRIRDHMDDILEARGYYRKHVARDDLSLFRAVADVLLHSQQRHAALLRHCLGVYRGAGRSRWRGRPCGRPDRGGLHADLRDLSDLLGVAVDVLESNQPDITTIRIEPRVAGLDNDDEEEDGAIMQLERRPLLASKDCMPKNARLRRRRRIREGAGDGDSSDEDDQDHHRRPRLLLCFSGGAHYDPIYPKSTVDNAGVVQSILYEALYRRVFGLEDAMEAATVMLNSPADPYYGKPDVYDKDFEGTAMEALRNFLIPFPYKVAKALDPETYRNIEFDVWSNERRPSSSGGSSANSSPSKSEGGGGGGMNTGQTIGNLSQGTPCVIRYPHWGEVYGRVIQPTSDRRNMEVYLPQQGLHIYVPRKLVLPIKHLPPEIHSWDAFSAAALASRAAFQPSIQHHPFLPADVAYPSHPPPMSPLVPYCPPPSHRSPPPPPPPPPEPLMLPRYSGGVGAGDSGGSGGGLVSPSFVPGMSPSEVEAQRSSNMSLVTRGDPAWMQKFNFQVPPPPFYSVGPPQVNKPEPEEQQQQQQPPPPPIQYSGATSASATAAVLDENLEPQQPQPPPLHSQSFAPLVSAPLAIQGSPFVQQSPTVIEDSAIVQVSNVDQNGNVLHGTPTGVFPAFQPFCGGPVICPPSPFPGGAGDGFIPAAAAAAASPMTPAAAALQSPFLFVPSVTPSVVPVSPSTILPSDQALQAATAFYFPPQPSPFHPVVGAPQQPFPFPSPPASPAVMAGLGFGVTTAEAGREMRGEDVGH